MTKEEFTTTVTFHFREDEHHNQILDTSLTGKKYYVFMRSKKCNQKYMKEIFITDELFNIENGLRHIKEILAEDYYEAAKNKGLLIP